MRSTLRPLGAACVVFATALLPANGQFFLEGGPLEYTGVLPDTTFNSSNSVALSADGSTAAVGYNLDNHFLGAVWIFTHSSAGWSQQGNKLVPNDASGPLIYFGVSVALSSDGNTILIGGSDDNVGTGAAWVFTRSDGVWSQQGSKLVGSAAAGRVWQGFSVALSADGDTALIGGPSDNLGVGAAWVFTRSGSTWTQQGSKLIGSGASGPAWQGYSVSLSADGNTALVGGPYDNSDIGAAWVFTRSGATWAQQGSKLVGTGAVGNSWQGSSVALSGDGNTALVGGPYDNSVVGAVWVYTLSAGTWSQQGSKLVGSGYTGWAGEGTSTALSADGNTALFGGSSAWVFTRTGSNWTQQGQKLVANSYLGWEVALSAVEDTAILEGQEGNFTPEAYAFAVPQLSLSAPTSADAGLLFNVTVTAADSAGMVVTGYNGPVHFTSTDPSATLPANATLTNGSGTFPVTMFTPGTQTISATDLVYGNITGTSPPIGVNGPPTLSIAFASPTIPLYRSTTLSFGIHNPNAAITLTGVGFTNPLPAGLTVASPSGLAGTCSGGTITAMPGSGTISLSGATIAASSSCSFSVNVTSTTPGAKNNVTGPVTSNESGTGLAASAALIVVAPPTLEETLGATAIPVNGVTTLTYTITNPPVNSVPLTGVALTNYFPQNLLVASPNGLTNTCGGSAVATAGGGSVTLSGGSIAASGSCTLTVNITVTAAALYDTNPTIITSANGGAGSIASATLNVLIPITFNTVPNGPVISVDGITYNSTETLQLPLSSIHTIAAASPQPGTTGIRYLFSNWSDGGTANHIIFVPAVPTTYTASFTTQYQLLVAVAPTRSGTVTPPSGGFYNAGTSVALTATADPGYVFSGWTGSPGISGGASATIVLNGPANITAHFQPAPEINSVVNSASFLPGLAAPNTILSAFGANLGCTASPQVLVNGVQAPLLFSSATQINFVIPTGLGSTGNASLQVVCNSAPTQAGALALAPVNPAIFTLSQNGTGQGAILNQDYSVNGLQSAAMSGSYIFVYVTGFGDLGAAGSDGLEHLTLPVTASIGGVAAQVAYAGAAPGYTPGLQQINILIPQNAPSGSAVPIQLTVGGVSTQPGVTVALQ